MTDTDIRQALARVTDGVDPSPELLDRVRAGGRRRVVRRRTVLAGGLAAAAAGVTVPLATRDSGGGGQAPPATGGDLAGDRDLIARVLAAWRQAHGDGDPRVHWVGDTPAGPVAVVTQPDPDPGVAEDVLGFVEPVGGELRAVRGTVRVPPGTTSPYALLAGARRDVLVVVTAGRGLWFSEDYGFDTIGRVSREYAEQPRPADGVLVRTVRPADDLVRFALMQDGPETEVPLANLDAVVPTDAADSRFPDRIELLLAVRERAWPPDDEVTRSELDMYWNVGTRKRYLDQHGYHAWTGPTEWYLRGAAPDGRRLVVQTLALDRRARAFLLLGAEGDSPPGEYLGQLEDGLSTTAKNSDGEPLPILHARLPHGIGVAVAAYECRLRYRVRQGSWLPVSGSAAVLPVAATEMEVTPPGGAAVQVSLP